MQIRLLLSLSFLIITFHNPLKAQSTTSLSGKIIDSKTTQPIEYGTVAVLRAADSSIVTGVVSDENGQLLGIFTHGDFVRHFQSDTKIAERLVGDLMTLNPVTVHQDKLAVEVLNLLERHRIDDLVVVDDHQAPVGIVDSQDLTKLKLL